MTVALSMPDPARNRVNGLFPKAVASSHHGYAGFWHPKVVITTLLFVIIGLCAGWGWTVATMYQRAKAGAIREQRMVMKSAADAARRAIQAGGNYDVAGVMATMAVYVDSNPSDTETAAEFRRVLDEWITKGRTP